MNSGGLIEARRQPGTQVPLDSVFPPVNSGGLIEALPHALNPEWGLRGFRR